MGWKFLGFILQFCFGHIDKQEIGYIFLKTLLTVQLQTYHMCICVCVFMHVWACTNSLHRWLNKLNKAFFNGKHFIFKVVFFCIYKASGNWCKFLNFSSSMYFVFIPLFGVSYQERVFQSEKTNKYKTCDWNGLSPTHKILEVFYGKLDITAVCEVEC